MNAMKAVGVWWLLVFAVAFCYGDTESISELLKRLNKTPVKSIKSPDGDIIDCVHINHQPAFDDPSLESHSIQMKPDYNPEGLFEEGEVSNIEELKQMWHDSGECPQGTIPITRTKKEDLLRAGSFESFTKKYMHNMTTPRVPNTANPDVKGHKYAVAYIKGGYYYGTQVNINLWKPRVQSAKEFSLSQLWIVGGSGSNLNTIEAGWQVYPMIYGDYNPRLFIYWTRDNYQKTGCYNLKCSGFIQTNNKIALGGSLSPVSSYRGAQYIIKILIWKDRGTGNWWMKLNDIIVGYWPKRIFPYLGSSSASMVEWGGEVYTTSSGRPHTTTDMGSGHFPSEGYRRASYINNIQYVNSRNILTSPGNLIGYAPTPKCYQVEIGARTISGWGKYFYYGGPGRNAACP